MLPKMSTKTLAKTSADKNFGLTLAATLVIASLAVALGAGGAAAASRDRHAAGAPRAHRAYVARHHGQFVRRRLPPYYAAPGAMSAAPRYVAGYTYLPGHGILDEACNLPTSACPNSERDGIE